MTSRGPLVETPFPFLKKTHKHELEYSNTEYLYDIYAAINYTLTSIQINPGLMDSFPILSGMATQFETYRFTSLEFYYKPFVAEMLSSNNVQLGYIGMGFVYDPADLTYYPVNGSAGTALPSKASFLNYEGMISAKPSVPLKFKVDCSRYSKTNFLYVRQGETSAIDLRLSDTGAFVWSCGDQQSTGLMGELYVKYTVKFLKSKPNYSLANSNRYAHYRLSGSISSTNPFGNVQTIQAGTNLNITFLKSGTTSCYFLLPPNPSLCNYVVYIQYVGTTGAWTFSAPTTTTIPLLNNGANYSSSLTGNSTTMNLTFFLNTPNNLGTAGSFNEDLQVTFTNAGWSFLASITSADIFVYQIPGYAYP